ncbi:MAG: KOW domain-containing RNA-binding protein [Clostridia bacterium]|nr:KOW domain-containing RNA-binding protein [Clostridia bacterium]
MIGTIVCSKAGSDKGNFSVIVKTEKNAVFISNGKRYKLSSPKKKNPKHLSFTNTTLKNEEFKTDKTLRKSLAIWCSNIK